MECVKLAARAQRAQVTLQSIAPTTVASLPPHLVQAAIRFVAEYQPGVERPIDAELEPEFRSLLLWVRYLAQKEAIAPVTPEEISREIADYRNTRMGRGVTLEALGAALMRAAAVYKAQDALAGDETWWPSS
jgi:hypothetical protein